MASKPLPIGSTPTEDTFTIEVMAAVRREGFEFDKTPKSSGLRVKVVEDQYIGLCCVRSFDSKNQRKVVHQVREAKRTSLSVPATVLVTPMTLPEATRKRLKTSFGLDAIGLAKVGEYLREWQEIFEDDDDQDILTNSPSERAKPPARRQEAIAAKMKANADAIIVITRGLAAQLDAKLDALRKARPNSDEGRAAIAELEELRVKVANLEKAVAKLKKKDAPTTDVVKAGTKYEEVFARWWSKSGPRILDKSLDLGIVMSSAGILALIGVHPNIAAGIAATVVTGKSIAGVFKRQVAT